jgi:choline dehydrogenase-like flavoprotein
MARDYYEANKDRPNLKVLCEALVSNVVLDGTTATGFEFTHGGQDHTVNVKREVIVSCGVVQSQIFELSGIGDPKVLQAAEAECRVELPLAGNVSSESFLPLNEARLTRIVQNFQDHVVAGL